MTSKPSAALSWLMLFALLFGGSWATRSMWSRSDRLTGIVVAVADGDTVTVLDGARQRHRIRLAFIDAPEKSQAFGQRAKQALSDKVFRQEIEVEVVDRDRYGREVGRLWRGDTDVNLSQLDDGLAWFYRAYAKKGATGADYARYEQAEVLARQQRRGLWLDETPTPPWDFRRSR